MLEYQDIGVLEGWPKTVIFVESVTNRTTH